MDKSVRLNKFLAERLGVSRREADEMIMAGKVMIGDKKATLGQRIDINNIDKNSKICYNGKIVPFNTDFIYLAFNKPKNYVCSRRSQGDAKTIYELLPKKYHKLKTVGRLDKDSTGLILLTNDGDFAFRMTHPKFRKNKVYEVDLDKVLEPLHQQMIMEYGVDIGDGPSQFKILKNPSGSGYIVILSEGRNRQIRRTFAALGYTVVKLHRTQFGNYELGALPSGNFTELKNPRSSGI